MGTTTKIQWADHTSSPWHGCQHATLPDGSAHPGCLNCYAERMSRRRASTLGTWGDPASGGQRIVSAGFHDNCRAWNRRAQREGWRESVFPSICDPFEEWPGDLQDHEGNLLWIDRRGVVHAQALRGASEFAFFESGCRLLTLDDCRNQFFTATIDHCPNLDFYLLTKRTGSIRPKWPGGTLQPPCKRVEYWQSLGHDAPRTDNPSPYRHNVWLLYSASDQQSLEAGVEPLVDCRDLVPVLGLSLEPLLGPLDLSPWLGALDWVIVGGESGPGARPMHPDWVRSIRDQCQAAGVPFFFKQWGEYGEPVARDHYAMKHPQCFSPPWSDGTVSPRVGKKAAGRLLDGREWSEFPEVLHGLG